MNRNLGPARVLPLTSMSLGALLLCAVVNPVSAQDPSCLEYARIPGFSSGDDAVARCRLDVRPSVTPDFDALPIFVRGPSVGADLTVVVDTAGRLVPEFTGFWTRTGGGVPAGWYEDLLSALGRWSFGVGRLDGRPVQYGFRLQLASANRVDSIPSEVVWEYRAGELEDTLRADWRPIDDPPPLTEEERLGTYGDVFDRLVAMRVFQERPWGSACLTYDGPLGPAVGRVIAEEVPGGVTNVPTRLRGPLECAGDVSFRRVIVDDIMIAGRERLVVRVQGDLLPHWPPGVDGRPARAWKAQCVVPRSRISDRVATCSITPVLSNIPALRFEPEPLLPARPTSDEADLAFAVRVTR